MCPLNHFNKLPKTMHIWMSKHSH